MRAFTGLQIKLLRHTATSSLVATTTTHYCKIQFAQRRPKGLRGGLLFLSVTVNPTIYRDGHFLFSAADIFALHGKTIYRGGHIKMLVTENTLLTVVTVLRWPPR